MTAKMIVKASAPGKKSNLTDANREWASRPEDERFWTLEEMSQATLRFDRARRAEVVRLSDLSVDDAMVLQAPGVKAPMTNWAFGQLCRRADVPAHFLRTLPDGLAAQVLRHGLAERTTPKEREREVRVGVRGDVVETFTSSAFAYIPNCRVCDGLAVLEKAGWRTPPARPAPRASARARKATAEDVARCGTRVKEGDLIAPAGLYASDRDMFAFLVKDEAAVDDGSGRGNGLRRGVFVSNSEVGAGAFRISTFLFDEVCGNHVVWGAHDILTVAIRHIGDTAPERAFRAIGDDLEKGWTKDDSKRVAGTIKAARKMVLGTTVDEVAERLVCEKRLYVKRGDAVEAFRLAQELDADRVDPCSVWGMVTGFTRLSQQEPHADRRVEIDTTGAGLMRLVDPTARCGFLRRGPAAQVEP